MTDTEKVALTALPRELASLIEGPAPTYRRLYSQVLDGRLPAMQVNGRYQVARADLPAIIAAMGLRAKEAAPAKRPGRKSPASSALVAA